MSAGLGAITSMVRSFGHAFRGLRVLMGQRNARVHAVAAVLVVALGAWLDLSPLEWAVVSLAMALVVGAEALNTGIELAVNLAQPEWHALARDAKDVAAAGVLICSLGAVAVGAWVLGPKLWALF
ncbi:diacylglycerol kinase family protein [Limnohabitans sp. Rim8]|uniref:diacylglycerol kinase family protein n=1 Tax=Limnohabitans sp. Rim8 TaxID=1100718 RepID=UPI00262C3C06|nr:diacylglycerol kinase family protein [Limnohabitans sp. Rim8]